MWAAASGDFDPIHYDVGYAVAQRLPGIIVNGRLKVALFARVVTAFAGRSGRVCRLSARHQAMDPVGEPIAVHAAVARSEARDGERRVDLEVWIENDRAERTAVGSATVSFPE